jgi:hypothetical protein
MHMPSSCMISVHLVTTSLFGYIEPSVDAVLLDIF